MRPARTPAPMPLRPVRSGAAFVHVLVTGSYTSCVGPVRPSLAERPPIRWIDPSTAALARWLRGVGIGARSGCHVSVDGS
jgi:hypothetical protein